MTTPAPIKLDPADYWRLRALEGDLVLLRQQLQAMTEKRAALWHELTTKHAALDQMKHYRAVDEDCSLIEG